MGVDNLVMVINYKTSRLKTFALLPLTLKYHRATQAYSVFNKGPCASAFGMGGHFKGRNESTPHSTPSTRGFS